ncbi:unnamed protein product [Linum trigynum]|uniref:Uncharacterized protein n=1 Tax=Linum trigynum TaxID=586398 RepID=A0AAV2GGL7_9ROSI
MESNPILSNTQTPTTTTKKKGPMEETKCHPTFREAYTEYEERPDGDRMPRYTVEEAYSEDEEPSTEEVEPSAIEQPQDSVSVSAGQGLIGAEGSMTAADTLEGQLQQPIGNPNNEEQDPERQFLKLPEERAMPDIAEGRSGSVVITGNQNTTCKLKI